MDSGSRKVRLVWRALALGFAAAVVVLRLGTTGCGSAGSRQAAAPPAVAPKPAAEPSPDWLRNPAYAPATKAGGGFYTGPVFIEGEPQQRPPPQKARPKTSKAAAKPATQIGEPR